jgi:hypothetical protein
VSGGQSALFAIVAQAGLLFLAGVLTFWLVERYWPGWGVAGFLLTVFNPSAIGLAFNLKTDLVFAVILYGAFAAVLLYCENRRLLWAVVAGLAVGVATNVRPTTQYLIVLLPLVFLLLASLASPRRGAGIWFGHGVAAAAVGLLCLLPWALHMKAAGEGWRLVAHAEEEKVATTIISVLTAARDGRSMLAATVEDERLVDEDELRRRNPDWDRLDPIEKKRRRMNLGYETVFSFAPMVYVKAQAFSTLRFFASGGEGYIFDALALPHQPGPRLNQQAIWWTITILAKGFAAVAQLLALVGLWALWRQKQYQLIALCLGAILYFVVAHPFFGWSRFRLPVELPLTLFRIAGLVYLSRLFAQLQSERRLRAV